MFIDQEILPSLKHRFNLFLAKIPTVFFVEVEKPRGREAVLHLRGSQSHHRKARTSWPGPPPPCPGPGAKPAL